MTEYPNKNHSVSFDSFYKQIFHVNDIMLNIILKIYISFFKYTIL